MQTIYKYPLVLTDHFSIPLPAGSQVLSVQMQEDTPCLWAAVDTKAEPEPRHFLRVGTGDRLPDNWPETHRFVGTFHLPPLVWHLFEQINHVRD